MIDPTDEDTWIGNLVRGTTPPPTEDELAALRRAFRYGETSPAKHSGKSFAEAEGELKDGWTATESMPWGRVRNSVHAGFDRTMALPCPAGTCGIH